MGTMYKFGKTLLIFGITLVLFSSSGNGSLLKSRVARSTEISRKCYFCMGEEKEKDNVESCSLENDLGIENCPIDDHFDKCMVFQAFSVSLNTTVFKRECTSERFCTKEKVCSAPDYVDCKLKCCMGDLCNDFDFKTGEIPAPVTRPTEEPQESRAPAPVPDTQKPTTLGNQMSQKCYFCMGNEEGKDNVESCSLENDLEIENCPVDDHFDKCMVFQAFSVSLNETVFKRECTSDRFCTKERMCSDPDYIGCKFKCCMGDLCNNFDFQSTSKVPPLVIQPTEEATITKEEKTPSKTGPGTKPPAPTKLSQTAPTVAGKNPISQQGCYDKGSCSFNHEIVSRPIAFAQYCKDNLDYMLSYCRKKCNLCDYGPTTVTQKPTTFEKVISTKCYHCSGETEGQGSVEACSLKNNLKIESCSAEDHFDKCMVFQAFSARLNRTIFKRKCTSENICTNPSLICSDSNYVDCRYECCMGDLCNNFDFEFEKRFPNTSPTVTPNIEITTKPECRDINTMCSTFMKQFCEMDKEYMIVFCRKSCNFCHLEEGPITKAPIDPITKAPAGPPASNNSEECVDENPQCRNYVTNLMNLPKFCAKNKLITSVICRKTCNFCNELIPTGIPTGLPIFTHKTDFITKQPTHCRDTRKRCAEVASVHYCNTYSEKMKILCPKSCGFCAGGSGITTERVPTTTSKACKDKRVECPRYANYDGYCDYQKSFMLIYCPKSCNFCDEINKGQQGIPNPTTTKVPVKNVITTGEPTTKDADSEGIPSTTKSPYEGLDLRWIAQPWSECLDGKQARVVRCYHFYERQMFTIKIKYCIQHVSNMPEKQRSC